MPTATKKASDIVSSTTRPKAAGLPAHKAAGLPATGRPVRPPYRRAMVVLITGPVRSGKSARAAQVAGAFGFPVTYVATARVDAADAEMGERVARHRAQRSDMALIELWQPGIQDLPAIVASAPVRSTLLVDSLGTWLAGHLLDLERSVERDAVDASATLEKLTTPLIGSIQESLANLVLVSEETGWGLVPPSAQGRIFRDSLGRLAQRIAQHATRVELVVAGYALDLKALGARNDS